MRHNKYLQYYQSSHLCGGLSLKTFRSANKDRALHSYTCSDWTANDWMTALVGEVGECANILKKIKRGDFDLVAVKKDIADELADILTYLDLLADNLGIDLERATTRKWDEVSVRVKSPIRIGPIPYKEEHQLDPNYKG